MGAGLNYLLKVANGPLAIWVAYWLLGFYLAVVNSTIVYMRQLLNCAIFVTVNAGAPSSL